MVESPKFEKLKTPAGALKSSGNVTVVTLLPGRVRVLEMVYSVLAEGLLPLIPIVTLDTVSEVALKFSNTICKLTESVEQSS